MLELYMASAPLHSAALRHSPLTWKANVFQDVWTCEAEHSVFGHEILIMYDKTSRPELPYKLHYCVGAQVAHETLDDAKKAAQDYHDGQLNKFATFVAVTPTASP